MERMTDTKELVERLQETISRIEQSPQRVVGGAGGQTMEATAKATIKQISLWDLETLYEAADAITTLEAENSRLEEEVNRLETVLEECKELCTWGGVNDTLEALQTVEYCIHAALSGIKND